AIGTECDVDQQQRVSLYYIDTASSPKWRFRSALAHDRLHGLPRHVVDQRCVSVLDHRSGRANTPNIDRILQHLDHTILVEWHACAIRAWPGVARLVELDRHCTGTFVSRGIEPISHLDCFAIRFVWRRK